MSSNNERRPSGGQVILALNRLFDLLKNNEKKNQSAPHLSHYREIPSEVKKAYELLHQGASLVHATSTKYTLVGKISKEDQKVLSADLLRGCELIGAATLSFLQDETGCSRAVRHYSMRASLAIFVNVTRLVESFEDESALEQNVGAQKTGAVWEACDTILNKQLPQGNRNAIRRELFTWTSECNDTMKEFQDMIDLGPGETGAGDTVEEEEEDFFGDEDQYSDVELAIATSCLGVLKCSRGTMKVTLEACEHLGSKSVETQDEKHLDKIAQLYAYARVVGRGITDFGSLLYPPLMPSIDNLESQLREQTQSILTLQDFLLGLEGLPKHLVDLANNLRNAAEARQQETLVAITAAKN